MINNKSSLIIFYILFEVIPVGICSIYPILHVSRTFYLFFRLHLIKYKTEYKLNKYTFILDIKHSANIFEYLLLFIV